MRLGAIIGLGGLLLAQIAYSSGAPAEIPQGDPAAGRSKASMCQTCHGIDGYAKIPIAPHIGGESASYIASQLVAFREGTRIHEMMSVVAKSLDDQTIVNVAAWYASQNATASLPADVSEAEAPDMCVSCHGATGISKLENVPNLAGESALYIDTQLKAYRLGKRKHAIMSKIAAGLSNEEIRSLADWYAAVTLKITAPN